MKIIIENDYTSLSQKAAEEISAAIKARPDLVLGLASGKTPVGLYEILSQKCQKGEINFSKVSTFNLDELVIAPDDPKSYRSYMQKKLFSKININPKNINFPPIEPGKFKEFENKIIDLGGIDLQILGIGVNGHIGFNEPGSSFASKTRIVELKNDTLVLRKAATMGIATIMRAKKIILLASGAKKAQIIFKALKGPITTDVPASILQEHPDCMVILDEEAAVLLT